MEISIGALETEEGAPVSAAGALEDSSMLLVKCEFLIAKSKQSD